MVWGKNSTWPWITRRGINLKKIDLEIKNQELESEICGIERNVKHLIQDVKTKSANKISSAKDDEIEALRKQLEAANIRAETAISHWAILSAQGEGRRPEKSRSWEQQVSGKFTHPWGILCIHAKPTQEFPKKDQRNEWVQLPRASCLPQHVLIKYNKLLFSFRKFLSFNIILATRYNHSVRLHQRVKSWHSVFFALTYEEVTAYWICQKPNFRPENTRNFCVKN